MSNNLVSLITPTFNQAGYLAATIDSVLAQSHPRIEYRVIDDGSTDRTPHVLAAYRGRVRQDRQPNIGQARALNRGWAEACGRYLAYLSSDDLLDPTAIARAVAVLDRDPTVACVYPNADRIDTAGRVVQRAIYRPFDFDELLVRQICWIGPGAVFRADDYRAIGGWRPDLRIAPDREFWLRLAGRGRFHFIPDVLAQYRTHPKSLSYRETSVAQWSEYLRVLDDFFARPDLPPSLIDRRHEAYGHANFLVARNQVRAGRLSTAWKYWRRARGLAPITGTPSYAASLARAAMRGLMLIAQSHLASTR